MKKLFSVFMILIMLVSVLVTTASAAPAALLTPTVELGQLKVCKVAGTGVNVGSIFQFRVNGNTYNVPAGPADRNGYCVLAGQYPVNTPVTVEEVIPNGYFVSRIEVKPDRTVSRNTTQGIVTVQIVSGVIEAIFTNKVSGSQTPTPVVTNTPVPTKTATSTPSCSPNCTPTSTPIPMGRLQICKEADGAGVTGSFTFRFETRSRSVPVGACAGLIAVDAGTLTITEDAQSGFSVADIYTIPADRLISKDLAAGVVTVRIVEGTVASQTIVIFRNRKLTTDTATPTPTGTISTFTPTPTGSLTSTPTFTPTSTGTITQTVTSTPTSTGTITPTLTPTSTCLPVTIYADFNRVNVGESIQGLGTVAPYLDIQAKRDAVKIAQAVSSPFAYLSPNTQQSPPPAWAVPNGGMIADGGFSDIATKNAGEAHMYTFMFASGVTVSNFSLHMLDYGDLNMPVTLPPTTNHYVSMKAYDESNNEIALQELSYTTPADRNPRTSSLYGDLFLNGDAAAAPDGNPGNWTWNVSGPGIHKVVLEFGEGYDPNVAFDLLYFTVANVCACQDSTTINYAADFSKVGIGQSVEGLDTVGPNLFIDGRGDAVRVAQRKDPIAYTAPNDRLEPELAPFDRPLLNTSLVGEGGFSDLVTKNAGLPHEYTFTFTPGTTVSNFSLHMLDFGDLNMPLTLPPTTNHYAIMEAFNASGQRVSFEELSYTTPAVRNPLESSRYGNLRMNGDALTAPHEMPGNWTWNISGTGITRVVLRFVEGYDPNIAFTRLVYSVECP